MRVVNTILRAGFVLSLLIIIPVKSFDQYQSMEFDHYTTNDGLSFAYTNCIFQDSRGFIWIGTGRGLNRFDGLTFKNYLFDAKDSTSLSGNVVNAIIEDTLGNMWIASSNGLDLYDRKKDRFSKKLFNVKGELYKNLVLTTCYLDSKGNMWIGTYGAIFRFKLYNNPQMDSGIIDADRYLLNEEDVSSANKTTIFNFIEDKDHIIWVASYGNKLFHYDEKVNSFRPMLIDHPEAEKFSDQQKSMVQDAEGDIFINIEFTGFLAWYRKENKFVLYSANGTNKGPIDNLLFGCMVDTDGSVWTLSRNKGGINIFNKKSGTFNYIRYDPSNPYSLSTNSLVTVMRDRDKNIWVGTGAGRGLEKHSPGKKKFKRYSYNSNKSNGISSNNILCFAESKTGEIWIGTDGQGLNKLSRGTGEFKHYLNDPRNYASLSSNAIISLCEDHEGTLWIGTFNGGLCKFQNNKFTTFYPDQDNPYSLSYRHIWYVFEDSRNNLWIATLNMGLDLFDRKTNRFYNYAVKQGDTTSLNNNASLQIYEDSKQNLYITSYYGVSVINLNEYDFTSMPPDLKFRKILPYSNKNSLSSGIIYCIKEDLNGNLWFGTQATGIDKFDIETGRFTNFSTRDGLPGNCVSSIQVDHENNLWLATDKGLAKFNPVTCEINVFDKLDGLQNSSLKGWSITTRDGEMFFGGPDGFNSFYPDSIRYNKNVPPVIITGLRLFNQPVRIGDIINNRILLENDISETKELTLKYNEDFIIFEFIALDYTVPEKNRYAYLMEGFDKDWIQCGTKREASYTNLDPGKYIFRVKACNNDGYWNETGTSIRIIILPPWWQTWWFRILAGIVIIGLVTILFLFRVNALRNQKKLLQAKVAVRTREIEEKNKILQKQSNELSDINVLLEERQEQIEAQTEELQHANTNLINLNATKDKFFSIIAHDLKNPFSSILGFCELLVAHYDKYDDHKRKKLIGVIDQSANNIYKLLENLLQWSRSQTGNIKFEPEEFTIEEVVAANISLVSNQLEEKKIIITTNLPKGIKAYADKNMINTVIRNLINNAIKYTEEGEIIIGVQNNNTYVTVSVKDSGVGMNEETARSLFRIGGVKSSEGTRGETGTGLGLIICKEFIEKNGGQIGVESILEKGSTFYFTIPTA